MLKPSLQLLSVLIMKRVSSALSKSFSSVVLLTNSYHSVPRWSVTLIEIFRSFFKTHTVFISMHPAHNSTHVRKWLHPTFDHDLAQWLVCTRICHVSTVLVAWDSSENINRKQLQFGQTELHSKVAYLIILLPQIRMLSIYPRLTTSSSSWLCFQKKTFKSILRMYGYR